MGWVGLVRCSGRRRGRGCAGGSAGIGERHAQRGVRRGGPSRPARLPGARAGGWQARSTAAAAARQRTASSASNSSPLRVPSQSRSASVSRRRHSCCSRPAGVEARTVTRTRPSTWPASPGSASGSQQARSTSPSPLSQLPWRCSAAAAAPGGCSPPSPARGGASVRSCAASEVAASLPRWGASAGGCSVPCSAAAAASGGGAPPAGASLLCWSALSAADSASSEVLNDPRLASESV